jgi:hypothetical protein
MLREAGFEVPPDPTLEAHFKELRYLEKSIGPTAMLAVRPPFATALSKVWRCGAGWYPAPDWQSGRAGWQPVAGCQPSFQLAMPGFPAGVLR